MSIPAAADGVAHAAEGYYDRLNVRLLSRVPLAAQAVLEIGCGGGRLARAFRARAPQAKYFAVELSETAAHRARSFVDQVVVGDIEERRVWQALDEVRGNLRFDVVVLGDILEHLRDPWRILAELRTVATAGSVCVACIPNVAHWSVLLQQLRGRWDYADEGLLDKSHLRFFTLATANELLRQAGWTVFDAAPRFASPEQTEAALRQLLPLADGFRLDPARLRLDLSATQWVIRAGNGPATPTLHVAALAIAKQAGVNESRVDYPLAALASLPATRVVWGARQLSIPSDFRPGVFILHRQFMDDPAFTEQMRDFIAKGWVVLQDMDDDPHHWPQFTNTGFFTYRAVHAVTVSTEPLAKMIRQWNPHVQVFDNAIFELPEVPDTTPKQGGMLRIFFGALNRGGDWSPVLEGIVAAALELSARVEFVVVHDRAFFDALPVEHKSYLPTLAHARYMAVLASCDLALLPLADTPFNRLKSDLKFIECCAAGAVPICSPVIYAERDEHRGIGYFAQSAAEWRDALLDACSDVEELRQRRARGLAYVSEKRMYSHQAATRASYYRGLMERREELEAERQRRIEAAEANNKGLWI